MSDSIASPSIDTFTRRAVRSWWMDGLWDIAVSGFFALIGVYFYYLVQLFAFPSYSWPWPFITEQVVNPLSVEIRLFVLGGALLLGLYTWLSFKLVQVLKRLWIAPRLGDVRHKFWMNVSLKVYLVYVFMLLAGWFIFSGLSQFLLGGGRFLAVICGVAPAAITLALGIAYDLPRYRWSAGLGLLAWVAVEFFFTTTADYMSGPVNFFDVSSELGNPGLPFLIWGGVFLVSGVVAFIRTMQAPHEQS